MMLKKNQIVFRRFTKGIGKTFLWWFLIVAMVPISILSVYFYVHLSTNLKKEVEKSLITTSRLKTEYIQSWFDNHFINLEYLSQNDSLHHLFDRLTSEFKKSNKSLKGFTRSVPWTQIKMSQPATTLKDFHRLYAIHDLFLIDKAGRILFTITEEKDLGTNILTGNLKDTKFAQTCKNALKRKGVHYSDTEFYSPSNYIPSSFIISPLADDNGDLKGLLAFQLRETEISKIMQGPVGLGNTEESFLVGTDFLLRSSLRNSPSNEILKTKVENKQTLLWQNHLKNLDKIHTHQIQAFTYENHNGRQVLGVHYHLKVLQQYYAIIVEIDEEEAFSSLNWLRTITFFVLGLTLILTILISFNLTTRIVTPLQHLSDWAKQIAIGDLSTQFMTQRNDEIGSIIRSIEYLVKNSKEIIAYSTSISEGDFSRNINLRSQGDALGLALQKMTSTLRKVVHQANNLSQGNYNFDMTPASGKDELGISLQKMQSSLKAARISDIKQVRLANRITRISEQMMGDKNLREFTNDICSELATILNFHVATFYILDESKDLYYLKGGYALWDANQAPDTVSIGQGMLGQAIKDKKFIHLTDNSDIKLQVNTSLARANLKYIAVVPLIYEDQVLGAIELGGLNSLTEEDTTFLKNLIQPLAIQIQSALNRQKADEKTQMLLESEEYLKAQQEELQAANEELEVKNSSLEMQKNEIKEINQDLGIVQQDLLSKSIALEKSNQYKSEFLANMSHELRTPLNSIILLSEDMLEDMNQNLTEEQIYTINIIQNSGHDLLELINDILDLSKIEAGQLKIDFEEVQLIDFKDIILKSFERLAKKKKIDIEVQIDDTLPAQIVTDQLRLGQILKNLISNAIKFTQEGQIKIDFSRPDSNTDLSKSQQYPDRCIAVSVEDSGIGIPAENLNRIFEAFKQADGSTSRKYGGTGLGLSITQQLITLLGGEIQVESEVNKGSTFTVFIPEVGFPTHINKPTEDYDPRPQPKLPSKSIADDRYGIKDEDHVLLVIEDDVQFAQALFKFCHQKKFKMLHAADGIEGLELAQEFLPDAIFLDINLPLANGEEVLKELKTNLKTKRIPVQLMSVDETNIKLLKHGALGFLSKPVNKSELLDALDRIAGLLDNQLKEILLVEMDQNLITPMNEWLSQRNIQLKCVNQGEEALQEFKKNKYKCIVLDINLPDRAGFELLKKLRSIEGHQTHIIVYIDEDTPREDLTMVEEQTDTIIIKGKRSIERLYEELTLFLYNTSKLGSASINPLPIENEKRSNKEKILKDKKILVVDDDMRNVFALTKILSGGGAQIYKASDGKMALEVLNKNTDIDLVLLDIMMPIMGGYETLEHIRKQERFAHLPIIALTAKAMPEDRDKCIKAGANDYHAKPIVVEELLSLIQLWLKKE